MGHGCDSCEAMRQGSAPSLLFPLSKILLEMVLESLKNTTKMQLELLKILSSCAESKILSIKLEYVKEVTSLKT